MGHKKANETVDKKKEATWAKQGISYLLFWGSKTLVAAGGLYLREYGIGSSEYELDPLTKVDRGVFTLGHLTLDMLIMIFPEPRPGLC